MDAEDWAFLRKFCLIALAITIVLAAIIMYFHSTAEPVTPSTSSRTSRVVSYQNGSTIELFNSTQVQQQQIAAAGTSTTNSAAAGNDQSSNEGLLIFVLIVGMLSGIGFYISRGGRLGYMRQPWQTF